MAMATYGPYTLEVLRGLSSNRDLLSCPPEGNTIDLWNENDGSGRQLWFFESTDDPKYYRIRVSGGMNNPSQMYLTGSGQNRVILGPLSNAIRQQWAIEDCDAPGEPLNQVN